MPHKTKKPFIDKKKSVTFQLVHRSQKDPLAADEDAPQRVLVPLEENRSADFSNETPMAREERWSEQRLLGIEFDDDYDYMQHLREPSKVEKAILVPKNEHRVNLDQASDDGSDEFTEVIKDNETVLRLPSVVFGSKTEEKIGMLHRAIPPKGPQPTWDPDIVAGLDDDFNFDHPDNLLEDDFIIAACGEGAVDDARDDFVETDDDRKEDFSSDFDDSQDSENDFEDEETKSRFTSYSMTSSVMRRNEHLSHLDDRFEKFFESYDDQHLGDLCQVDIDGNFDVDNLDQKKEIKMLLGIKEENEEDEDLVDKEKCLVSYDSDKEDEMVAVVKEVDKDKWDCESILSTYSTLYNHPRLIEEPKKIRISERTGMPVQENRRLNKKMLAKLDQDSDVAGEKRESVSRRKDESKEEKAARKRAVKEARKERRQEKKATKKAFQAEKTRQSKELINVRQNLSGLRIT